MIYLDNHATTPVDPRVVEAMVPMMTEYFANAGSITHDGGRQVAEIVADAHHTIAAAMGADAQDVVITSGATESNNLALLGFALHPRQTRRKIISTVAEHRAILDPLSRLEQLGFEVIQLPVHANGRPDSGSVDLDQLASVVDDSTALVTIMLANNEIGTIAPLREIANLCHARGAILHSDATQAVGRIDVNVDSLDVDLLSFSAHKFYGPKGIGGLYVRRTPRRIRLQPQIVGGGQQDNRRSGTLNSPGIVGMARALELCQELRASERLRVTELRNLLYQRLMQSIEGLGLNGPTLDGPTLDGPTLDGPTLDGPTLDGPTRDRPTLPRPTHDAKSLDDFQWRLGGNLNCSFWPVEGQSLMLAVPELAVSSGSACTSSEPRPSHVLQAIGLSDERARSSLRFGVGRFTTTEEIERASMLLAAASTSMRSMLG